MFHVSDHRSIMNYCITSYLHNVFHVSDDIPIMYCIILMQCVPCFFIYLFFLHHFPHCTGHIMTGSWKGRGNQHIQLVKVLYCKLSTNGKQLPAFKLEAVPGTEPWPQRWEARVSPLCYRGPCSMFQTVDLS